MSASEIRNMLLLLEMIGGGPIETKLDTMVRLTKQVRDEMMSEYGELTDTCSHAADRLSALLADNDIHGVIVTGIYRTKWGRVQHRWINVDDLYLDPTREQFGGRTLVFPLEKSKIHAVRDVVSQF